MLKDVEINSSEIIDRMKKICDVSQDKELAEILGLVPNAIHGWKKKNSIPFSALLKISVAYEISLDFLIYGKSAGQALSTHEKMALIAFNELSDRQKIQALAMMGNLAANGLIPPSVQLNQIGGTHNRQHVGDE